MLRVIKFQFSLSQLAYHQLTPETIQKYQHSNREGQPQILNFNNQAKPTFLQNMLSFTSSHEPLLQLYLNYLQTREAAPQGLAYHYLDERLRKQSLSELTKSRSYVQGGKVKVINSQLIETTEFMGIYLHRELNLNFGSYSVEAKRPNFVVCKYKPTMRSEAFRLEETIIKQYKQQKMEDVYGLSYADFMEKGKIKRYVYEMIVDLNMTFMTLEDEKRGTRQSEEKSSSGTQVSGISKHLIQIESFFHPSSNLEEFYLTDVDFIMKGNSFFREKLPS